MAFPFLPFSVSGPSWDASKNKWKWIFSIDESGIIDGQYGPGVRGRYFSLNGNSTGFEVSPASFLTEPDQYNRPAPPYTIWLSPRTPGNTPSCSLGYGVVTGDGYEYIWYTADEPLFMAPCVETTVSFGEPVWNPSTEKFDVLATATPNGGIGPYSYVWSGSGTGATKTVSGDRGATISATCTITDNGGGNCSDDDTQNLLLPDTCPITVELSYEYQYLDGDWYATVSAAASGGNEPYMYDWGGPTAVEGGGLPDGFIKFAVSVSGNHVTVGVTDATDPPCEGSADIDIPAKTEEDPIPPGWYCVNDAGCLYIDNSEEGFESGVIAAGPHSTYFDCQSSCNQDPIYCPEGWEPRVFPDGTPYCHWSAGGTPPEPTPNPTPHPPGGSGSGSGSGGVGSGSGIGSGSGTGSGSGSGFPNAGFYCITKETTVEEVLTVLSSHDISASLIDDKICFAKGEHTRESIEDLLSEAGLTWRLE